MAAKDENHKVNDRSRKAALILIALGVALMERADFGISMVVAPSYLLHLKMSETLPWFSFGVAEYLMQTVVLLRQQKQQEQMQQLLISATSK